MTQGKINLNDLQKVVLRIRTSYFGLVSEVSASWRGKVLFASGGGYVSVLVLLA